MLMVASTESLRQQNRALILAALRERGAMAHTDMAQWTGLSSATVSAITADLLSEQIIIKTESPSPTGRGRPRVLFIQNPDAAFMAAIRITSEEIEYSAADYAGTLKDRFSERRPSSENDPASFAVHFKACLEKLLQRSGLVRQQIKTISITSKGLVAAGRPVLLWSPVFGGQKVDFEEILAPDWQTQIILTNETQFAAKALANKLKIEAPQFGTRTTATLSLGHSIGLGIAVERPGRKVHSTAPAFGHMNHTPNGSLCRCGARGCIEAYAGFYGILRTAFDVPSDTIPANFVPLEEIDKLADNARRGDRKAGFAFRQAGEVLGIGVSRLMSMYGPMPLMITGHGLRYYDLMKARV